MKRSHFSRQAALMVLVMTLGCGAANAQNSHCPGWNNPSSFVINSTLANYQGKMGIKQNQSPDVHSGQTTVVWDNDFIPANQMATSENPQVGGDQAQFPSDYPTNRNFAIYTTATRYGTGQANRDPNTNYNLPYVPNHLNPNITKSIRVGTGRGRTSGGHNATALYYTMWVNADNALMYLYFASVLEPGGHGTSGDPLFMIRVMRQNSAGQWVQASPTRQNPPATGNNQCDTMAYFISSTHSSQAGGTVTNGVNGWHIIGSNTSGLYYKDWEKVLLDLSPMLYTQVRIEVMVTACSQVQHYSYGYIAGDCQPMKITSSGCPAGTETNVTVLSAPSGLRNYVWYRSEYGTVLGGNPSATMILPDSDPESSAYYTFHRLTPLVGTEADSANFYRVTAEDFRIPYRSNSAHVQNIPSTPEPDGGDSLGNKQVFRCEVTSAINPAIEYKSNIYTEVQNIKPTMDVDTLSICGGDVRLRNRSYVTGSESIVNLDSTFWYFYNNAECNGAAVHIDTGETSKYIFEGEGLRGVKVLTNIHEDDPTIASPPEHGACYSEGRYAIRLRPNPVANMNISTDHGGTIICEGEYATLYDNTTGSTYREWHFRAEDDDSTMILRDTVRQEGAGSPSNSYQKVFTHRDEPIEMIVRNGYFYLDPEDQSHTIWCEDTTRGEVSVFKNPKLHVEGDSIVCKGDSTLMVVSLEDTTIGQCTFQWSYNYGQITGGLPSGDTLAVPPVADTTTYYVRVKSQQGCIGWSSARAFLVTPKLTMIPADGKICPGQPVTLIGTKAHHFTWSASPADSTLVDSLAQVVVYPQTNTTYTMVGHGSNNCDASPLTTSVMVYPYPVPTIEADPYIVDSQNPTVTLRDVSPYSVASLWTFDGGEEVMGREVTHTFEEASGVPEVRFNLHNVNELGCDTNQDFTIPVILYTAWFPNIFTPGSSDENAHFKLYTVNTDPAYEIFHIYIYNRFGQLVYESGDPQFEWDGTMADGTNCPQGTYTYICRYRKPGAYTVASINGSITLVR